MDGKKSGAETPKETKYEKAKKKFVEAAEKNKRNSKEIYEGDVPLIGETELSRDKFNIEYQHRVVRMGTSELLTELDEIRDAYGTTEKAELGELHFRHRVVRNNLMTRFGICDQFDKCAPEWFVIEADKIVGNSFDDIFERLDKLEGRLNNHRHKLEPFSAKPEY